MSGFEWFTVLSPATSKEVRSKLHALSPCDGLELTVSPETVEGVILLRSEPVIETFYRRYAKFGRDEIVFTGHNNVGDHITLTVSLVEDGRHPAIVTVVRRSGTTP